MKCPHCGMNIRENITECGYCGGKIAQRPDRGAPSGKISPAMATPPRTASPSREPAGEPDAADDEEEGDGLSRILQPGEQVLIGALNVSVKKFFFHAYLTDQRIFLVDTQEKKLKVTAKDIPRSTIADSSIEVSENSDPVLVLSIRSSTDDEVKTMKLVFAQNGMDRSAEIDEWLSLLQNGRPAKKAPKRQIPPAERPVMAEDEVPVPARMGKPAPPRQPEIHPARKPLKELEKQPPVKRLLSMYNVPEEEPAEEVPEEEPELRVPPPARKSQIREVPAPVRKPVVTPAYEDEEEYREEEVPPVRKPEVQSAMKVAMKSAMRPLQQQSVKPVRRTVTAEPEPEHVSPPPVRRPVVHEPPQEKHAMEAELPVTTPQFCHNCGKKLPHAANFCPGCGTKLSQSRTLPQNRHHATTTDKRVSRMDTLPHEHRAPPPVSEYDEDEGGETPVPAKPPIKKAPKGSEMTILHKFLRR